MSSMLDQAIIDAEALKEAAIKNAEATIVEKYSNDIKQAVDQLLEQGMAPPPDADMMDALTAMAPTGPPPDKIGADIAADATYTDDPHQVVSFDLRDLVQEMKMDDLDPSEKQVHELVAEEVTGGEEVAAEGGEETFTIQESVLADILGEKKEMEYWEEGEDLEEDTELEEASPIPSLDQIEEIIPQPSLKPELEEDADLEERTKRDTPDRVTGRKAGGRRVKPLEEKELQEALRAYQYNYAKLYESHQAYEQHYAHLQQQATQTNEQNKRFRELLVKTQEKLNEVNVRNAQLHYTNRTLVSDSLNERQKDKIVEAIQKAGTVGEAKVIFETLQSAVGGARSKQNAPKSLNEAIGNRSSAFLPRKREETQTDSTMLNRLQKLAGIK